MNIERMNSESQICLLRNDVESLNFDFVHSRFDLTPPPSMHGDPLESSHLPSHQDERQRPSHQGVPDGTIKLDLKSPRTQSIKFWFFPAGWSPDAYLGGGGSCQAAHCRSRKGVNSQQKSMMNSFDESKADFRAGEFSLRRGLGSGGVPWAPCLCCVYCQEWWHTPGEEVDAYWWPSAE